MAQALRRNHLPRPSVEITSILDTSYFPPTLWDHPTLFTGVRGRRILRSSQGKQYHMIARFVQHVWSMCGVERIPNQRRSDDFEVQTIIGHGGPDDAHSSDGARPPCDRCSKAPRYAPGEFDDRGAGTGRP